jgi:hypothetical protein
MEQALETIREYARVQAGLLAATQRMYPEVDHDKYLLSTDRAGTVPWSDETWTFRRHGKGLCYTGATSRRIVDVHSDGAQHPRGFDAWRLVQYFESLRTSALWFEGHRYDTSDVDAVDELLAAMAHGGAVERVPGHVSLYVLGTDNHPSPANPHYPGQ